MNNHISRGGFTSHLPRRGINKNRGGRGAFANRGRGAGQNRRFHSADRRRSPSPSPIRRRSRSRSRSRSRRRDSSRSPSISRRVDPDRRIADLERQLRDSKDMIRDYTKSIGDLQYRLMNAVNAANDDGSNRNFNPEQRKERDRLQMQVQTQSILLRQLQDQSEHLVLKNVMNENRLKTAQLIFREISDRATELKTDCVSMRKAVFTELATFQADFEGVQGRINSVMDNQMVRTELAQSSLRMDGKIVVEERHLKDLLETVINQTREIAKDFHELAVKKFKGPDHGIQSHH